MTFNPNYQSCLNIQALKMSFVCTVVRKINPPTVASQWKILSPMSKKFSSSTDGFSTEEIEKFRKVFRTMPSYRESISSKELIPYLQTIKYNKPIETYQAYIDYADKMLDGRFELAQTVRYLLASHDSRQLMNEYLLNFDKNNDGYVSKEEFEFGMRTLRYHDPRTKDISYENFLKEADTNKDGKISVAECKEWLDKNVKLSPISVRD